MSPKYLLPAFLHPKALLQSLNLRVRYATLADYDLRLRAIVRRHVGLQACWSLLCMCAGVAAWIAFTHFWQAFWLMSAAWGAVNWAIAAGLYQHVFAKLLQREDTLERMEVQRHVEKMLYLNMGLDIAYVGAGLYLRERGLGAGAEYGVWYRGFGWAVMAQGGYLLAQDLIVYRLHRRNYRNAWPIFVKRLGPEPNLG